MLFQTAKVQFLFCITGTMKTEKLTATFFKTTHFCTKKKKKLVVIFSPNWFCSKTFCGTLFKEFKCTTDFYFDSSEFQKEQKNFWAEIAALFNYHYPINDVRNSIRLELALIYYKWIKAIKT